MTNVLSRIKQIQQPRGGLINPKELETIKFEDDLVLFPECISPMSMGLMIDYLTRWQLSGDKEEAFSISISGGRRVNREVECYELLDNITGLDDNSLLNAYKLTSFDSYARSNYVLTIDYDSYSLDGPTCDNIRIMVGRSLNFLDNYGPVRAFGFDFEGGYSNVIDSGDGDFLTEDTLWDFKVSIKPPTKDHTLQVMTYYVMGLHSYSSRFDNIHKIGIFNPRLNTAYILDVDQVSQEIIEFIENEVICY